MKTSTVFWGVIVFVILATASNAGSQVNYTVLNINKPLSTVIFNTPQRGFIYGFNICYATTDGGVNWEYSLNDYNIGTYPRNSVFFIDSIIGWATQYNWDLFKTTNGGVNWFNVNIGIPLFLNSVYFTNQYQGWACGYSDADLLKTNNGGANWMRLNTGMSGYITSLCFPTVNVGFVTFQNSDKYGMTTDGGFSWVQNQLPNFRRPYKFFFVNSQIGWMLGESSFIMKTSDGGVNWTSYSMPWNFAQDLFFIDSLKGWVITDFGGIWKTINGGINWVNQRHYSSQYTFNASSIYFTDSNTGFAAGNDGNIISTTNSGDNWKNSGEFGNENIRSVDFIDNLTGWICTDGTIRKSTNSGYNWVTKFVSSNYINSVRFADNNVGCAIGSNNIFKTNNGGENWSAEISPVNLTSIYYLNSSIGWICGNSGTILKTTNGGINWFNQTSNSTQNLYSITAADENYCFSVGSGNVILKSSNGGNDWYESVLSNKEHKSIYFINSSTGFIISNRGYTIGFTPYTENVVYITTNTGVNWNPVSSEIHLGYTKLNGISFSDSLNGTIIKSNGKILVSYNGGLNWLDHNFPVNNVNLLDITTKNNSGWIVGTNATIVTSSNNVVGINNNSFELPGSFKLFQNYPNPFNPSTTIRYSVIENDLIRLSVYSVLGKRLETLVNENQNAGSYFVDFNGANYASGIYYYKLEAGDFSEVRKMILLK